MSEVGYLAILMGIFWLGTQAILILMCSALDKIIKLLEETK